MHRYPIIILSTVRTGSTAFFYDLQFDASIKIFNEPILRNGSNFELLKREETVKFFEAIFTDDNYALKLHVQDLRYYPGKLKSILAEHQCHLIRIRRRNLAEQIASYYIETIRNKWGYPKESEKEYVDLNKNIISINRTKLKCAIASILAFNAHLNSIPYKIDEDHWYEDIVFREKTFIKTPKPSNYDELLFMIDQLLKDYNASLV